MNKIINKCKICGADVKRMVKTKNTICFDCKMDRIRKKSREKYFKNKKKLSTDENIINIVFIIKLVYNYIKLSKGLNLI